MPMATNWRGRRTARAVSILIGYNLPFALWSAYVLATGSMSHAPGWTCPVEAILGWCPGCGLTGAYRALLFQGQLTGWWLPAVLAGFAGNGVWSCMKAARLSRRRWPGEVAEAR